MLAIRTADSRISITRPEQIEVGGVYVLRGTVVGPGWRRNSIPAQLVVARTPVIYRSVVDVGYMRCILYVDMGGMGRMVYETALGMDQVNIPEHGAHDHHLERVPQGLQRAFGILRGDNREQDYEEMITG
jgi:hypothetical protein